MNGKFNPKMDKIWALISIFKKGQVRPAQLLSYLRACECGLICFNISECPWKCLNKLFWLCQGSEYAWSSYNARQAYKDASGSKCARVLNMARLYMQGLCRILNMLEYDSIFLNVFQYAWPWLNIAECPWISLKMSE